LLAPACTGDIAIVDVRCWTGLTDRYQHLGHVDISAGQIVDIGDGPSSLPNPTVLRGGDLTLLPGLADLHVHLTTHSDSRNPVANATFRGLSHPTEKLLHGIRNAWYALAAGFTSLRVIGHRYVGEAILRDLFEDEVLIGPRLSVAPWWVSMTGGHGDMFIPRWLPREPLDVVDGMDDCRRLVRTQFREGGDFVKVMAGGGILSDRDHPTTRNFTIAELEAIVDEAHALGMHVAAHAISAEAIEACLAAGVDTIEHGNFATDEQLDRMAEAGTVLVPTLSISEWVSRGNARAVVPAEKAAAMASARAVARRTVAKAYARGVAIGLGTDSSGHVMPFGLHALEMALLAEVGLPGADILRAATSVPAQVLGVADRRGTIEVGKDADLVLVEGDPLSDPAVILRPGAVRRVIVRGRDVTAALEGLVSMGPGPASGRLEVVAAN